MNIINYLRGKATPYILAVGLATSFLTGCKEKSEMLHEEAIVSSKYKSSSSSYARFFPPYFSSTRHIIKFDGDIDFVMDNFGMYNRFNIGDLVDITYKKLHGTGIIEYEAIGFIDAQLKIDKTNGE